MTSKSSFREYMEEAGHVPPDCVLGQIAWFTVEDAPYSDAHIRTEFERLTLNPGHLPAALRPDSAFEKATKEAAGLKYDTVDGPAEILVREVARDAKAIRRQLVREIRDAKGNRLRYEKVGEFEFYRAVIRGGSVQQDSARCRAALDMGLSFTEREVLAPVMTQFEADYVRYRDFHDGQKIRGILREYLVGLNAVALKPSVYFVHNSRIDELNRLKEFADGLGTASMMLLPQLDLPQFREDVIDAFQAEAEKDLAAVVGEIVKLRAARSGAISLGAYKRIKEDYDRVMAKAAEYGRTLQIGQDRTAGAAELAVDALQALQADVVRTAMKVA